MNSFQARRNKEQIIKDNKYIFNLANTDKKGNNNYISEKSSSCQGWIWNKKNINQNKNSFDIKPNNLYKDVTKNLGIIIPEYKSVRSVLNRSINKNFSKDIKEWEEIPNEHV